MPAIAQHSKKNGMQRTPAQLRAADAAHPGEVSGNLTIFLSLRCYPSIPCFAGKPRSRHQLLRTHPSKLLFTKLQDVPRTPSIPKCPRSCRAAGYKQLGVNSSCDGGARDRSLKAKRQDFQNEQLRSCHRAPATAKCSLMCLWLILKLRIFVSFCQGEPDRLWGWCPKPEAKKYKPENK